MFSGIKLKEGNLHKLLKTNKLECYFNHLQCCQTVLKCHGASRSRRSIREKTLVFLRSHSFYFSSTIARSHGPSVSESLFETGFSSNRFTPAEKV